MSDTVHFLAVSLTVHSSGCKMPRRLATMSSSATSTDTSRIPSLLPTGRLHPRPVHPPLHRVLLRMSFHSDCLAVLILSRSNFQATPEQIEQLSSLLNQMAGSNQGGGIPEMSLSDILTPANITPLFTSHPQLIPTLFPYLPPDLPSPPSQEAVERIVKYDNLLLTQAAC